MFSNIRTAIVDKITNDVSAIQVVYRSPRSNLEGAPAAVVEPSENEADYASTSSDRRVYAFKVRIYYKFTNDAELEAAETALEEALEQMLDAFTQRSVLGEACDWVQPVPSVWQYEERADGVYRMAELTLRCIKYQPIVA
jgi:hypothetical protein